MKPKVRKNLSGLRFGKLTVSGLSTVRNPAGAVMWNCVCDCGRKARVRAASLSNGNTKSCGCLKINHLRGENNYQARRIIAQIGEWTDKCKDWYGRAGKIMERARREKIPCDFESTTALSLYLKNIAPEKCPVFGFPLLTAKGAARDFSPSADRILPSKGYVRGNIQIISMLANKMKQNATPEQLDQFAMWHLKGRGYVITKQRNTVTS